MIYLIKWIKCFHETLKHKPYGLIWIVYGIFLVIISFISMIINDCLKNKKGLLISSICLIVSLGIMCKPIIIDTIEDVSNFLKEVNNNIKK